MSIAVTATISVLLSLISLGSSVAFNDVVSLAINGLYTSYLIGNGLLLYHRLKGNIKPFSLAQDRLTNTIDGDLRWGAFRIPEPFGTINNALGCAYMIVILTFSFFPTGTTPTAAKMNYSSLMIGAVVLFAVPYYFAYARKTYKGPVIETDLGR